MALVFYCGSGSPFAWKVWLALEHKKVPYEFRLLSFDRGDTRSPEFRAVNPRGKVPAIVDDGFALWESGAIVEYLEDRYPRPALLPADPKSRATARRLMAEADAYLGPAVTGLFNVTIYNKGVDNPADIAKAQDAVVEELARVASAMTGDYFVGTLSLADFAVFPHVRIMRRIDERQPKNGIGDRLPAVLGAWMKRIEALPYYAKTIPPHWKG
ncbi:MAG: glutathione S-transferase family protein [Alphaproteobacteria bacterium]